VLVESHSGRSTRFLPRKSVETGILNKRFLVSFAGYQAKKAPQDS
jgi:hypothetical protein